MGDGLFLLVPVLAAAEEIALGPPKVLDGLRLAPVYVRAVSADPT